MFVASPPTTVYELIVVFSDPNNRCVTRGTPSKPSAAVYIALTLQGGYLDILHPQLI